MYEFGKNTSGNWKLKVDQYRVSYQPNENTYKEFLSNITEWTLVPVDIKEGSVITASLQVEAPVHWSKNAVNIAANTYFRRAGVPTNPTGRETSIKELVHRITYKSMVNLIEMDIFASKEDAWRYYAEVVGALIYQEMAPNTPIWINYGLDIYDINKQEKNWQIDFKTGEITECNAWDGACSSSACFISPVADTLENGSHGLMDHLENEMRIFRSGGGNGFSVEHIRGKGEPIQKGAGISEGLPGYLPLRDANAGYIKSGGVSRRSATMIVCSDDHPDLLWFTNWKALEEQKARALIAQGYPSDYRGEVYKTISGQNSNNSVLVTDKFMQAADSQKDWALVNRTDGEVKEVIKADEILTQIAKAAWECADPGLIFKDTVNEWWTASHCGEITACNPCAEVMGPAGALREKMHPSWPDASGFVCRLLAINVLKFFDGTEEKVDEFKHTLFLGYLFLLSTLYREPFPTPMHAAGSWMYRSFGINFANIGAMCMAHGYSYASAEARALTATLSWYATSELWLLSSKMANIIGPYPAFSRNHHNKILQKHIDIFRNEKYRLAAPIEKYMSKTYLYKAAVENSHFLHNISDNTGVYFANSTVTCYAPTGTVGIIMDLDTFGIEPDYSLVKYKQLVSGDTIVMVNETVKTALLKLGYTTTVADNIITYIKANNTVEGAPELKSEHADVFLTANNAGGIKALTWRDHIDMMAAVQPFISMSISKTVNLPTTATIEEIKMLYMYAWRIGLKAVAVYRDQCKASQPLNTSDKNIITHQRNELKRVKPPDRVPSLRFNYRMGGVKVIFQPTFYPDTGELAEIFIETSTLGEATNGLAHALGRAISIGLQYGIPSQEFIETFAGMQFSPNGFLGSNAEFGLRFGQSIPDLLSKFLYNLQKEQEEGYEEEVLETSISRQEQELIIAGREQALKHGFRGYPCAKCGSFKVLAGCHPCYECGNIDGKCQS